MVHDFLVTQLMVIKMNFSHFILPGPHTSDLWKFNFNLAQNGFIARMRSFLDKACSKRLLGKFFKSIINSSEMVEMKFGRNISYNRLHVMIKFWAGRFKICRMSHIEPSSEMILTYSSLKQFCYSRSVRVHSLKSYCLYYGWQRKF